MHKGKYYTYVYCTSAKVVYYIHRSHTVLESATIRRTKRQHSNNNTLNTLIELGGKTLLEEFNENT